MESTNVFADLSQAQVQGRATTCRPRQYDRVLKKTPKHRPCVILRRTATITDMHTVSTPMDKHSEHLSTEEVPQHPGDTGLYDWESQWYPVAFLEYLDPKVPTPVKLLGKRLVLWRDAQRTWRSFEDKCPHRLAPLSEGRIEPSDGTLMCSYHGWRFQGDGKCTQIPQAHDAEVQLAATANPRSCATSHPTQVLQGKLWVFGRGGPQAFIDSAAVKPAGIAELDASYPPREPDGGEWCFLGDQYMRDLPYGWSTLVENVLDPAHINFSHHGVIGDRQARFPTETQDQSMTAEVQSPASSAPSPHDSLRVRVRNYDDMVKRFVTFDVQFQPPCLVRWGSEPLQGDKPGVMAIYTVPTAPGRCRVLFSILFPKSAIPLPLRLLFSLFPKWWKHIEMTKRVLDGDSALLHAQEKIALDSEASVGSDVRKLYYMPTAADRIVSAFRAWMAGHGGGGPVPLKKAGDLLPKEELLNHYSQHTTHCPSCSKGLESLKRLRIVVAALGTLCTLGVTAGIGAGVRLTPRILLCIAAGGALLAGFWAWLSRTIPKFYYTSYEHSLT